MSYLPRYRRLWCATCRRRRKASRIIGALYPSGPSTVYWDCPVCGKTLFTKTIMRRSDARR